MGILTTAIDCFSRYGYGGTSIDRIARAAGVTKGALYYHFRDKEQLLFEAVTERIEAFENQVLEHIGQQQDPARALESVGRICAQSALTDNHRRFILILLVEALGTHDALSHEFREMLRRFRGFHRNLIREGQASGLFRKDIDAASAAETYVAGILGAELQHYQDPESTDVERSCQTQTKQFLAWLGAPQE